MSGQWDALWTALEELDQWHSGHTLSRLLCSIVSSIGAVHQFVKIRAIQFVYLIVPVGAPELQRQDLFSEDELSALRVLTEMTGSRDSALRFLLASSWRLETAVDAWLREWPASAPPPLTMPCARGCGRDRNSVSSNCCQRCNGSTAHTDYCNRRHRRATASGSAPAVAEASPASQAPPWNTVCPICLEASRHLHQMPCQHGICTTCWGTLQSMSRTLRCPLCRRPANETAPPPESTAEGQWHGYLVLRVPHGSSVQLGLYLIPWSELERRLSIRAGGLRGSGYYLRRVSSRQEAQTWWGRNGHSWPPVMHR